MFFLKTKKILYFPGCLITSVLPEIAHNYEKIFSKLNIDIFKISQNICCGAIAYSNGYTKDFENIKERVKEIIINSNVKNIVTNSANCYWALGIQYGLKIQHVTQLLMQYKEKLPIMYDEEVSYYDPPALKIYNAPRAVLEAVGFKIIELEKNKENSIICGAEGGMIQNTPQLADKLAKKVFDMVKTKKLIVADPLAYHHLKNNAPSGIKVLELGEVLNK